MSLGLLVRRPAPGLGLLPTIIGLPLLGLERGEPFLIGVLAMMVLLYSVAAHRELRTALIWLALCEVAILRDVVLQGTYADLLFVQFFLLPPWFAGRGLRDRRLRVAELEALTDEL